MKTCYVSIAFGRKVDLDGREVDYDRVYAEMIRPAVEAAGLRCQRGDEFSGALIHKEILRAVVTADVMIADVSNGNGNVMYELGMRHALRPSVTLIISSSRLPFNISHSFAVLYQVGADGAPEPGRAAEVRSRLTQALLERVDNPSSDSPLYEYFPNLRVEIPPDLRPPRRQERKAVLPPEPPKLDGGAALPPDEDTLRQRRADGLKSAVTAMQRQISRGAPAEAMRVAEGLGTELAAERPIRLLLAQAAIQVGNYEGAASLLSALVRERPEDAEALALLGSLLKRRHMSSGSTQDLDAALDMYRRAYALSRQDLYLGRNLAQLLHRRQTSAAQQELALLLPELGALARHALDAPPVDYWTLQSVLIIAVLAGDEAAAERHLADMLSQQPQSWMLESSRTELQGLIESTPEGEQRERLRRVIDRLDTAQADNDAAEDVEADDAQP
jgi:tetratricopeptide (TPR) repeat protein